MPSQLSELLHLFIDAYSRDCDSLRIELERIEPINFDAVSLDEQARLLDAADQEAREEIFRKTLINTEARHQTHINLKDSLQTHSEPAEQQSGREIIERLRALRSQKLKAAEDLGSVDEYEADMQRRVLKRKDIASQLLRFFADHLDQVSEVIYLLDDTDFTKLIPECLIAPFRECHINFVFGNYGTTLILCGAVLERALRDLLASEGTLYDLISEAEKDGLLEGYNLECAKAIHRRRNQSVHGSKDFDSFNSTSVWKTISDTRTIVADLYRDRIE